MFRQVMVRENKLKHENHQLTTIQTTVESHHFSRFISACGSLQKMQLNPVHPINRIQCSRIIESFISWMIPGISKIGEAKMM